MSWDGITAERLVGPDWPLTGRNAELSVIEAALSAGPAGGVVLAGGPGEREVALMAASGLSSRTIAAKLQLSVRTVSNHLAHVYAKFGVVSGAELAALLTTAAADRPA